MSEALWLVVLSDNRWSADQVAAHIRGLGVRSYCPMYRKILRGVRIVDGKRRRTRGAGEVVERPAFGRYLFAEHHRDTLASVIGARGVAKVLRYGDGKPKLLADEIIELVREMERDDDSKWHEARTTAPASTLKPGDIVRIGDGPFAGLKGRLESIDPMGGVFVLLEHASRGELRARTSAETLSLAAG